MSDLSILCAADLHLGRRPADLRGAGAGRVASKVGWSNLVDRARADAVDLVVLAGDVIDELNRSFEAYGPLEQGVRALKAAGIPVVAVAGNHDHDTLPDVAAEVGGGNLVVLGQGGEWERWTLEDDDGAPRLHVDGWSFPDGTWREDPTIGYDSAVLGDPGRVPVLGLLHADLDQAGSPYGPVSAARLRSLPPTAWVLGHIHVPSLNEGADVAPILYPGSLQALDSGERGPHGAWILELHADRTPAFRQIALSSVRYDRVTVDLKGVEDEAGVKAAVLRALTDHLDVLDEEATGPLQRVQVRVRVTGRTPVHGRMEEALGDLGDTEIPDDAGLRLVADSRPVIETRPPLELESLARGSDAAALLAGLLLQMDNDEGGLPEDLARRAAVAVSHVADRSHYLEARLDDVDADRARDAVRRQATRLLGALVAEKETS